MNHLLCLRCYFVGAAVAALFTAGCTKNDRDEAASKVKDAYADTKAAVISAWDHAKSYTFAQRDRFADHARAMSSEMDAKMSKLRAEAADQHASAERRAALAELKDADADYKQKVAALGDASAATWNSAKQNVVASWDRLQAAYYRTLEEPEKK